MRTAHDHECETQFLLETDFQVSNIFSISFQVSNIFSICYGILCEIKSDITISIKLEVLLKLRFHLFLNFGLIRIIQNLGKIVCNMGEKFYFFIYRRKLLIYSLLILKLDQDGPTCEESMEHAKGMQ